MAIHGYVSRLADAPLLGETTVKYQFFCPSMQKDRWDKPPFTFRSAPLFKKNTVKCTLPRPMVGSFFLFLFCLVLYKNFWSSKHFELHVQALPTCGFSFKTQATWRKDIIVCGYFNNIILFITLDKFNCPDKKIQGNHIFKGNQKFDQIRKKSAKLFPNEHVYA